MQEGTYAGTDLQRRLEQRTAELLRAVQALQAEAAERQTVAAALREAESQKDAILNEMSEMVVYHDTDLKTLWANRAATERMGIPADGLVGRYCWKEWFGLDGPCENCLIQEAIRTGRRTEREVAAPDGRSWLARGHPVTDERGRVIGAVEVILDVTERKRTAGALRDSELRFGLLAENTSQVFWFWDSAEDRVLYLSPSFAKVFGRDPDPFYRDSRALSEYIHPDDLARMREAYGPCRRGGPFDSLDVEYRIFWPDGSVRWLHDHVTGICDEQGRLVGVSGIVDDITQRKQSERNRAMALRILEQLNTGGRRRAVIQGILRVIKDVADFHAVAVRLREQGGFPYFAAEGFSREFSECQACPIACGPAEQAASHCGGESGLRCMCEDVLLGRTDASQPWFTQAGSFWTNEVKSRAACANGPCDDGAAGGRCRVEGYESLALIPLRSGREIVGLLQLGDRRRGRLGPEFVEFLEGIAYSIGVAMERTQAEAALRRSRERLRSLAARLESVREEERTRLARTIHDDLGHVLTALKMDMMWLDRQLALPAGTESRASIRERIGSMAEAVDGAIRTAREMASDLRPGVLDDLGLAAALEWASHQFQARTGIECTFVGDATDVPLRRRQATALYRICQELLTNVVRHAGAATVKVTLSKQPGELILEVADDGKGITEEDIASFQSLGILGMRERAVLLGGEFHIAGSGGEG
ncbi:MAG: sensor histidine kinase, partial [Planctomycetota bacterium]